MKYQAFIFLYGILWYFLSLARSPFFLSVGFLYTPIKNGVYRLSTTLSPPPSQPYQFGAAKKRRRRNENICSDKYGGLTLPLLHSLHIVIQTFTHFRGWIKCDNKSTGSQYYYTGAHTHTNTLSLSLLLSFSRSLIHICKIPPFHSNRTHTHIYICVMCIVCDSMTFRSIDNALRW